MRFVLLFFLTALLTGCANLQAPLHPITEPKATEAPAPSYTVVDQGRASWYGKKHHGKRTASGERFNANALTAAHKTLPFGTQVRVTNLNNGRHVMVTINDRGPFSHQRVIDLSQAAAKEIGLVQAGVAPVKIEKLR